MALIGWPALATARIERIDLQPISPSQVEHPFANAVGVSQVLQLGHGSWQGVTLIGATDAESAVSAAAIEAFFAGIHGAVNTTEMPLMRPTIAEVAGVTLVDGVSPPTFALRTVPEGLGVGQYVRRSSAGELRNLYVITAYDPDEQRIQLWPTTPFEAGETIMPAPTIHVRARTPASIDSSPRVRRGFGPWQFVWKEARS